MKALILAGGRGTRLRPLTHTQNKHLLPIGNEPMIFRIINDAIDLGIKDIIINVNKGDTSIKEAIENSSLNANFQYIEQPEPNGMMYPIKLAEKLIGDNEFFFSAGDNILAGGLKTHYDDFKKKKSDAHILVVKRPDYQQFGVAVIKDGRILKAVEKPKEYVSDLVLTAIYFFTPIVFKAFENAKPIDPKGTGKPEFYPPVVINWFLENNLFFSASEVTGWWKDTGKPEDLIAANMFALNKKENFEMSGKVKESKIEGDVELKENSQITNSTVRGPVSIGKNVTINNSYIGPFTSIGDDSIIENAQIENSIIMGKNTIKNVKTRLDSCLIGWSASVTEEEEFPRATSLLIGDDSVVKL